MSKTSTLIPSTELVETAGAPAIVDVLAVARQLGHALGVGAARNGGADTTEAQEVRAKLARMIAATPETAHRELDDLTSSVSARVAADHFHYDAQMPIPSTACVHCSRNG
jgi:hypothetical protein